MNKTHQTFLKRLHPTMVLLLFLTSSLSAAAHAQIMSLKLEKVTFKELLAKIESETGYYFLYSEQLGSDKRVVSVDYRQKELRQVLDDLGERFGFEYTIVDKTITLVRPEAPVNRHFLASKQTSSISGTIKLLDPKTNTPVPAANATVLIRGRSTAATTDEQGFFTIEAEPGNTLLFRYLGYQNQELYLNDLSPVNIVLIPASSSIAEVVVSGYGIREAKENQVGSAYVVTSAELERRPTQRVDKLLEGLVPGFEISTQDENNSSVRQRYRSRIRGEASVSGITSNEPLWIIDGVQINTGGPTNLIPGLENSISPLSFLNPEDIETITVLKDASATTIYGASGSNGVILITTKTGTGRNRVSYSHRSGFERISENRFQVLNAEEYNGMLLEMGYHDYINDQRTDWYDVYYRNGFTQQHNLSFSGSSMDGLSHYISAGVRDEKMTIIGNTTQRYTLRTNIKKEFKDRLTLYLMTGGSYAVNNLFNPGDNFYMNRPNMSHLNPDGTYALRDDRGARIFNHPIEAVQNDDRQRAFMVLANGGASFEIMKGLLFRTDNGLEFNSTNENAYRSMRNNSGMSSGGSARRSQSTVLGWTSANTLSYNANWNLGTFDVLIGMEAKESMRQSVGATGSNFANDWIREVTYAPDGSRRGSSGGSESSSVSYFGRVGYVWDKRYAFTASMRKDGDSNFGTSVKWGTFATAGLSWTVSNERFWNDHQEIIDFLKFKVSYGNNGNARFAGNYARGIYSFDSQYAYDGEPGATMTRGVNEVLRWENTNMLNTGVDFGLFGVVDAAVEYYYNVTDDVIDNAVVSLTSGQRRVYQNNGKVRNSGVEVVLEARNMALGDVGWSPKVIVSANRNKVLELPEGLDRSSGTTIRRVGYPAGSHYLVRWAGVDPRDGGPLWYDINDNITKVYNAANRVIVGTSTPDFYGSFLNSFNYRNFFLSGTILFNKGGLAFSALRRNSESDGLNLLQENQSRNSLDHWKNPGDLALAPRLSAISTSSTLNSTRYLHDKTHIRISNASVGYNFDERHLSRLFLRGASIYIQADNIGFWTPYQRNKDRNTYRNSFTSWPEVRSISLGANLNF